MITIAFVVGALILPIAIRPDSLPIKIGDVSSKDIVAPRTDTYISEILTARARKDAELSVSPKYLPADASINRSQVDKLIKTLNYFDSVRADQFSNLDNKLTDLKAITFVNINDENANLILTLSDDDWQSVKDESTRILDQVMRNTIRNDQLQLFRDNVSGQISYSFSPEQAKLIQTLVTPLIEPNSKYSESETIAAQKIAANAIQPIKKEYAENQAIILRGQIISPEQYEALEYFDLIRAESKLKDVLSTSSIVIVLTAFIVLYFSRRKIAAIRDLRNVTVIAIGFVIFLYAARIIIPNRTIIPYFFPLPAFALVLVTLFNIEIGIFFSLPLSILATHGLSSSVELTVFYIVTSLVGALTLSKGRKFSSFLWAGLMVSIAGILVIAAYRLINPVTDLIGLITLFGATVLNGFASASLALLLQFLLAQLLGLPTPMHLIELSRSDHPLLKHILQLAPGTYQHSLQVANLAEQAAESIGADALLTRVGTLFHDAGKSSNATFFVENQIPGNIDSHDNMDPVLAAQVIIKHISDGTELADKYHLPPRLKDFIREHHGTQITRYQYTRALDQQDHDLSKVDIELFRYPGPKPQTKETGILMLADACEARARAELPKDENALSFLIQKAFDHVFSEGQLENTNLTLKDLKTIQESFLKTLSNTYHPRIKYPETKNGSVLSANEPTNPLEKN